MVAHKDFDRPQPLQGFFDREGTTQRRTQIGNNVLGAQGS